MCVPNIKGVAKWVYELWSIRLLSANANADADADTNADANDWVTT